MRSTQSNAFDVLRLGLAVLVVYTHACLLGGFGEEGFARLVRLQTGAGPLAVLGFFGISGFLVTQSFVNREDWKLYLRARLLRILPGFWLALVLTAFLFAPLIAHFNESSKGWHFGDAANFVIKNAFVRVREYQVGEVLSGLPYAESINGALWSLFPELVCYGVVLALGVGGMLSRGRANVVVLLGAVFTCHVALVLVPQRENLGPTVLWLTGWTPFIAGFLTGAAAYLYRSELNFSGKAAVCWGLLLAVLLKFGGWHLLSPIVLPLALIHGAHAFRASLPVDLSYGVYVFHFPILQLLSAAGVHRHGFLPYFLAGLAVTAGVASVSWFLVERPALRLKTSPQSPIGVKTAPPP